MYVKIPLGEYLTLGGRGFHIRENFPDAGYGELTNTIPASISSSIFLVDLILHYWDKIPEPCRVPIFRSRCQVMDEILYETVREYWQSTADGTDAPFMPLHLAQEFLASEALAGPGVKV